MSLTIDSSSQNYRPKLTGSAKSLKHKNADEQLEKLRSVQKELCSNIHQTTNEQKRGHGGNGDVQSSNWSKEEKLKQIRSNF